MKKRIASVLIMMIMVISLGTPISFGASKTAKMTAYQVIKKGNTVYCASQGGICKVNLKNGKVTKLYKNTSPDVSWVGCMKKYKGYLYFYHSSGSYDTLYRMKLSNKKVSHIKSKLYSYAIKNGKLYYRSVKEKDYGYKIISYVAKLNGKGQKKTTVKASTVMKTSNANGYRIKSVTKGSYCYDYLVKPSGKKIKLWKYRNYY